MKSLIVWFLMLVAILVIGGATQSFSFWHGTARPNGPNGGSVAVNCPTFDTTGFPQSDPIGRGKGAVVISNCLVTTGNTGLIYAIAEGEVTCAYPSDAALQMWISNSFTGGANFTGSISGATLTVTSMTTPSPFVIATGQTLYDANSGSQIPSGLTIIGQIDGMVGGVGHYSLSGSASVASEAMWSLVAAPICCQLTKVQEDLMCRGFTTIETISAVFPGAAHHSYYVIVVLNTEIVAGPPVKSASWKNGQISILTVN